ncbi:ATP-binding protein [Roseibium sp.]|uniref:sensor histidine kinase n=1 Tax=Roseibium sp. TaxID=1936156 RepID=UPI003D14F196
MTRIPHLWLPLLFCLALTGLVRAETVNLQPGRGVSDLKPHLVYLSDPSASLGDVLKRYLAGGFSRSLKASMLDWNYAPEAWAAVEIFNATLDDGRAPDPLVLTVDLPLVSELDAYVIRQSGFTENLINYSIFEPFEPQDHSVTRLRTPVFTVAPQEKVTVLVNFKFGPFQSFKMALETPAELEASAFASGITHTAFYAFTISCLIFFFGFHLAMKNWIGLLFAVQFSVGLAFIAYIDGLWFRFFFPDRPEFQSPVGFFLLFALSGTGFVIAGRSLAGSARGSPLSRALTSLALLSAAGFLVSLYSPGTYAALFGYGLVALMFAAVFLASRSWRAHEGAIHLAGLLISALGAVFILLLIAAVVLGIRAEVLPVATAVKGLFSVLLIATMTSLTAHIINLRRKHADAVRAQMAALEAEAKSSRDLLVAERNYTRAQELARLRQRQLATASHDLKQPIASLRLSFENLAGELTPDVRQRLTEAFDYMEALSASYLEKPAGETEDGGSDTPDPAASGRPEIYDVSLVLDTVQRMFGEEAVSKGLELRRISSSRKIDVAPVVVLRILSNLVANAVNYTERGKVLIGVRNRGERIDLCVLDTGKGMDENEIRSFSEAYVKGETSEGHGLGLAVCFDLARENGLTLTCRSERSRGTGFFLSLPAAG